MKRHFLDTEFGQLHYITAGQSKGTTVVLLHKTPRSIDQYRDVIPLLEKKYHVIAVDTLGYGDSDKPEDILSIEDFAGTVKLLLDKLKIKKAVIVGHLTGAIIGVEFAAAYPDRILKLVMSGPIYVDENTRREHGGMFSQWRMKPDGSHITELWQSRAKWIPDSNLIQRCIVDVLKSGETSENAHISVCNYHMEDRLPLVKCPVMLIIGKKDPWVYPEKCKPFKTILPKAKEVLLEEGALFIPDELPETFSRLVTEFIENR